MGGSHKILLHWSLHAIIIFLNLGSTSLVKNMAAKPTSKASDVLVSFNHDICKILSVSATTLFELTQRLFAIGILNIHTKSVVMSRGGYKGADALLDYLEMRIDIKPEILHSVLEAMRELEVLKYVVKEMEKWEGEDVQISQDNILFTACKHSMLIKYILYYVLIIVL